MHIHAACRCCLSLLFVHAFFSLFYRFFVYTIPLPPRRGQHTVLCHPRWLPTSGLTEFAVCWGGTGFEPRTSDLQSGALPLSHLSSFVHAACPCFMSMSPRCHVHTVCLCCMKIFREHDHEHKHKNENENENKYGHDTDADKEKTGTQMWTWTLTCGLINNRLQEKFPYCIIKRQVISCCFSI
jgi:hypothetical protein